MRHRLVRGARGVRLLRAGFCTTVWCLLAACAGLPATLAPEGSTSDSAARAPAEATGLRPDERRAEQAFTVDLAGMPVALGASYELSHERRLNFDLDRTRQRGRDVLEHEIKFDARGPADRQLRWFVQGVVLADRRTALLDRATRNQRSFERGQTWLSFEPLGALPVSVQIGRIALIEKRAWWWDDDLDAVRVSYAPTGAATWRLQTGLGREVFKRSSDDDGVRPEQRGVTRWFGHASTAWKRDHLLEGFWLMVRDRSGQPAEGEVMADGTQDDADPRLTWTGLRASGEVRWPGEHRLTYRADLAWLRGRETRTTFQAAAQGPNVTAGASRSRRVQGHAWDLGAQWRLPGAARPTLSLALAQGSGGLASAADDRNFRQTGLQENKARTAGVKRFRFYGELLDPELSNLRVATLGFGLRALNNNSAELMVHRYGQVVAAASLAGSRLSLNPTGASRHIGNEVDLLFAMREWKHVELTLKLSRFAPGDAFAADRQDAALSIEWGATLNF